MISTLRGLVLEKTDDGAVVEAGGVGYAVSLSGGTRERLPAVGAEVFLRIEESTAMYGGGTTLYGFSSEPERKIFRALRENVPGAGAKKALDLLDKASKSLPDFRRAVQDKDVKGLVTIFGFTAKTAEKVVSGLYGKLDALPLPGPRGEGKNFSSLEEVIQGLVALGYREAEARDAARSAQEAQGAAATPQDLIRDALRRFSPKR